MSEIYKDIFEDCLDELLQKLNCPICYYYDCGYEDKHECDECNEKVCIDCIYFLGSDVHDHNLCKNCYNQQAVW